MIISIIKNNNIKHKTDFYCLNCLHSSRTKSKLELHERVSESKDFHSATMSCEVTKVFTFNQNQKSDKATFIIYAYLECLIEKCDGCKNNSENSSIIISK